ncbi:MAG: alpha/beta hydrolase, partial [Acidimicrobiia bacterium]
MPFSERGETRIRYEEAGTGFPLLVISGGGLNSAVELLARHPFDPFREFADEYRVIGADLRNANATVRADGTALSAPQSSGPLEVDRPWDAYADDQLGLMDHLGCDEFLVLGFCIGGPFIWNLLRRAPDRIRAAVLAQPSGYRPELPDYYYSETFKGWGRQLRERRPDITTEMVHEFLTNMYTNRADFVFSVSRDFVQVCETPILVLPDDVPAHPYDVAMEMVRLAPNSQVSLYPWNTEELTPLAVR